MPNNIVFKIYYYSFLMLFLQSMHVWFLWGNLFKILCPILFLCCAYLNHRKNPICYRSYSQKYLFLILIAILALLGVYDAGFMSISKVLIGIFALFEITLLSKQIGKIILLKLTKLFGIISLISLIGWVMFLLNIPLPHNGIIDDEFGYTFENYYVFLYNGLGVIPRFCSIFLEPGYYGQLAAIFLFANNMKLNNVYLVFIFIAILFSLSLAGYVLLILGFLFTYIKKGKIVYLIFSVVLGIGIYHYLKSYNEGDNPINNLIFSRLEIQDGKLSGDHRSTDLLDRYYSKTLKEKGQVLFGVGSSFSKMNWGHGVAGYKAYIVEHGYVGLFLALIGYFIILFREKYTSRKMILSFIFFMALYWQAAYPYWFSFFSLYVFCISIFVLQECKRIK